jgi:hypothetical protein
MIQSSIINWLYMVKSDLSSRNPPKCVYVFHVEGY